jgi:hypothetical protein
MTFSSRLASALLAAAAVPALAHAAPQTLVSGQTLTLPLTEATDGPLLKFEIAKATLTGSAYQAVAAVSGETRAERRARGDQVVLDNDDGRRLVKFARFAAEDLRGRYAANGKPVTVTVVFEEGLAVNQGGLWGDALKAGFTFGVAAPSTTPIYFNTHMAFTIAEEGRPAQTLACDARDEGRMPQYERKGETRARAEMDRMQDVGRMACFAQISAKLMGEVPAAEALAPKPPGG